MTQREQQILRLIEADPMISQQTLAEALGITRSSVAVHISNLIKKGYIAGKGYVVRPGSYAVVVGGVNMDIGGRSFGPIVEADSNPGTISVSLGGVGRNIAHNLALLGADVRMLTALGGDLYGQRILSSCAELGIDVSQALRVSELPTSTYLYIASAEGEMALALSDMAICDRITPEYLAAHLTMLHNSRAVVLRSCVHQKGRKASAHSGQNPYTETKPAGSGAAVRNSYPGKGGCGEGGGGTSGKGRTAAVYFPGC